jgi:hypothetical protein
MTKRKKFSKKDADIIIGFLNKILLNIKNRKRQKKPINTILVKP